MIEVAIATPTYNEARNIDKFVTAIANVSKDLQNISITLLIIDDNSPDGTSKVVKRLAKQLETSNFKIEIMDRRTKDGLGKAYTAGFKRLLGEDEYKYILQMDADLSHDPKYIPEFIESIKSADFVSGSRYVLGGATPDWQWHRKVLSRWGNSYTRLILGTRLTDYTGGYNMFSTDLLKKINLDQLQSGGYGFVIELKYKALLASKNNKEIPIVFMDRVHGESKLPKGTIIKNSILVIKLKLRSFSNKWRREAYLDTI